MKRSKGAVRLARTGETQDEIATAIGVSRAAVGYWINGTKKPGPSKRALMAERYKIGAEEWDEEAKAARATAKAAPAAVPAAVTVRELERATGEAREALASGPGGPGMFDTLAIVARLGSMAVGLLDGLEADEESFPLEKARVMSSVAGTAALVSKMNGDFDLGARLFKTPIWKKIEAALAAGLEGHPAAAASVARELRRLGAGGAG